jgi:hypothetical protein
MTGVALVMGGCVFGGVTAIALHLMGQRTPAIIMAVVAAVVVVAGITVQASGVRRLKAAQTPDSSKRS